MKNRVLTGITMCAVSLFVGAAHAADASKADPANYAGLKSCKMCHKKEASGNQYGKWVAGPHSKTFEVLGTAEAKAVAAKLGIDDPQQSGKCLKCHSTAYHWTETVQTEKIKVEEGVTCESCHGAGKNYKSKTTMKSHEASIAGGMVYPATDSCTLCHNDGSPTWKDDRYEVDGKKVGFDPVQASEKIKHPNPNVKH